MYKIQIDESASAITDIGVRWRGSNNTSDSGYPTQLKIRNWNSSVWTQLYEVGTSDSNTWFSGTISASVSNYIDSGDVCILAKAKEDATPSCPLLYGWNGNDYEYITETIPASFLKRYETTDYERAIGLQPKNGYYEIMLAGTQEDEWFINSLGMRAIDHPQGTIAIPGSNGEIHTIKETHPIQATGKNGQDITHLLNKEDDKIYRSDISGMDFTNIENLFDWITITLPLGHNNGEIKLFMNARSTSLSYLKQWGFLIYLLGSPNRDYLLERLEHDKEFGQGFDISAWYAAMFKFQYKSGDSWVDFDKPPQFAGLSDDFNRPKIVTLDLGDISTDEIRLVFSTGMHQFDYIGVDYSKDEPVETHNLALDKATLYHWSETARILSDIKSSSLHIPFLDSRFSDYVKQNYQQFTASDDVFSKVTSIDENYAYMEQGDFISFRFPILSPPDDGMQRTFIINTHGYFYFKGPEVPQDKKENIELIEEIVKTPPQITMWALPRYYDCVINEESHHKHCDFLQYYQPSKVAPPFDSSLGTLKADYVELNITYEANNAPSVNSPVLWDTEVSPSQVSAMSPQVEYNVKVGVTDNDNLSDLSTVKVTIFYDSDGSYSAGDVPSSGNTQTAAILTWTNGGGWSIDPSASTTWTIESSNCVAPTLTNTTGTFEFHFKPGKVASETTGSAKWHIYAKADDGTDTGDNHQDNRDMNWYGEISGITSSLDFGAVALGCSAQSSSAISAKYISNGAYDEQVKSSGTWLGQTSSTALDLHTSDTNPGIGQFSLKADDDATQADSVQVLSASYVTIDDTGTQTGESGDTVSTNHCWLWLGGLGIPDEEYQGTIYFQIGDGA